MTRRVAAAFGVAAVVALGSVACSSDGTSTHTSTTKAKRPSSTAAPSPSAKMSATKVLGADLAYSDFDRIVAASGLGDEMDKAKALTLFVPSNAALASMGDGGVDQLVGDPDAAKAFVQRHAVDAKLSVTDLLNHGDPVTDEAGTVWKVAVVDGQPTVGGAGFGPRDIPMRNGYLHVLTAPGSPTRG